MIVVTKNYRQFLRGPGRSHGAIIAMTSERVKHLALVPMDSPTATKNVGLMTQPMSFHRSGLASHGSAERHPLTATALARIVSSLSWCLPMLSEDL